MPTDSGPPYRLRLPQDVDVADVPADLANLAADVTTALNGKVALADANSVFQSKIKVVTQAEGLGSLGSQPEGTIVFLIP